MKWSQQDREEFRAMKRAEKEARWEEQNKALDARLEAWIQFGEWE